MAWKVCTREVHESLKTSEEKFRSAVKVIGIQRLRGEPGLLLGNCLRCNSTLGFEAKKGDEDGVQDRR